MKLPKELVTVTRLSKTLAIITFLVVPIIAFGFGIKYEKYISSFPNSFPCVIKVYPKNTPTPTKTLKKNIPTDYSCPESGWVDCMPGTQIKPLCNQTFFDWAKTNCPNFKGGAY